MFLPSSKICALRKMELSSSGKSTVQKALRLDRITVSESGRKSVLGKKVEEFLCQDENSAVVPDKKKANNALRYRLSKYCMSSYLLRKIEIALTVSLLT